VAVSSSLVTSTSVTVTMPISLSSTLVLKASLTTFFTSSATLSFLLDIYSPFNLYHDIRFNLVALFDIVEVFNGNTALVSYSHFFGIILISFLRIQFTFINHYTLSDDSNT